MMEMSNREIAYSYRTALNPKSQISILADLNCTSSDEIRKILRAEGIDVPERKRKKKEEESEMTKEEPARQQLPESVLNALFNRLDELNKIIEEASKEYLEIADYMEGFNE